MFKKNVLLLGFTIIMVIGMLTYLFAWSFHNNMSGNQGMEQSPLSMEDKYPQGKLILDIVKSDIPQLWTLMDNSKELPTDPTTKATANFFL